MKKFMLSIALSMLGGIAFAQKTDKALHIGNQMPEYSFPELINSPDAALDLKAYRGKYLILDFWSTSCSSCLEGFPHMQELQNKFQDRLNIILVNVSNWDSKVDIEKELVKINRNKGIKISLPVATFDKTLSNTITSAAPDATSYFPYQTLPHEIIIDPDGKVLAITNLEEITNENIENMLSGKKVDFLNRDFFLDYNIPLIANKNSLIAGNDGILMNSSLTGYCTKIANRNKLNAKGEQIGKSYTNVSLFFLYSMGYKKMPLNSDAVIYDTKNPVFQNPDEDPAKLFCYDLVLPAGQYTDEKYAECLRQDLDRIFSFKLRKEKRALPCLIIKTNSKISKSYSKFPKGDEGSSLYLKDAIENHISVFAHGMEVSYIPSQLAELVFTKGDIEKIIDESGEKNKIDIDFPVDFDLKNFNKVKAFLSSKGIDLSVEIRELEVLVISDKKTGELTVLN